MSEEAAAFARHDESPFPIVPDDAADAADIPPPGQLATDPEPGSPGNLDGSGPADPIVATVLSADSRQFVRALISQVLAAADDAGLGIALSRLGQALAEDWRDETLTFQSLVDGLDRGRLDEAALRRLVPIVAAFVTRRVTGEMAPDEPEALHRLLSAAQTVVEETLAAGGSRQWRRLPRFAATIAERAAQRELPLGAVAEMLPRLGARFGLTQPEPAGRGTVVSISDDLRGDPPRGAAADEPRRMVISGPVEIVILDR